MTINLLISVSIYILFNYFSFNEKIPQLNANSFYNKPNFDANCVLFMVIILPASLKSLSLGVEVAGIAKYFLVNFDNTGNRIELVFYQSKGQSSIWILDKAK